jgi:hypothetical protein
MSFRVVALSGPAGCGKDTAAHHLKNRFGFGVYAFAWPIKAALNAMFGWRPESWDNREWKETVIPGIGKSPRQMAQTLGTEWGRNLVNADLWLLLAEQRCHEARAAGLSGLVFTDCRFVNEAQLVRRFDGIVIQIERDACAPVADHVSEKPLPPNFVNYVVRNNGTLEAYYACLRACLDDAAAPRAVPEGTVDEEALDRCGHMSRTKRVCERLGGHGGMHADKVTRWHE